MGSARYADADLMHAEPTSARMLTWTPRLPDQLGARRSRTCFDPPGSPGTDACRARSCGPIEGGLTIVELIVALVLTGIAFAIFASGVVGALSGGSDARNSSTSTALVSRTLDAIDDDVARAFAQHRDQGKLRDPLELKEALQRNRTPASSDPYDRGAQLDRFDDVVKATPTQLVLMAEVDSSGPGPECVVWSAGRGSGGAFVVTRTISIGGATCGATLGTEQFLSVAAGVAAGEFDSTPFSYSLVCHRGTCPGAPAGSNACEPWIVDGAPVADGRRRWVVGVTTSLTNVDGDRGAARASGSSTSSIRSRHTDDYRAGLGC